MNAEETEKIWNHLMIRLLSDVYTGSRTPSGSGWSQLCYRRGMIFEIRRTKLKIVGALVGALVAGAAMQEASATQFADVDVFTNGYLLPDNNYAKSGTFNINQITTINPVNYSTSGETLVSAEVAFMLLDFDGVETEFKIKLGGENFMTGLLTDIPFTFVEANLSGDVFLDLAADGILDWQIKLTNYQPGDTLRLLSASLYATGTTNAQVPDGGVTVSLMGLSLLGVGLFLRRSSGK